MFKHLKLNYNTLCHGNFSAGATSEGVLANFFNSLLSKKTGSPGGPSNIGSPGVGGTGSGSNGNLPPSAKKSGKNLTQLNLD